MSWLKPLDGRGGGEVSSTAMESRADIVALWPRWMRSAHTMLRMKALVRSRCAKCGTLLRVELEDIVARHGPGYSLVDRLERCRMVGCVGTTFYVASRTYGREWTALLRDPALVDSFDTLAPTRTVLDLRSAEPHRTV